jgi:hypothetical protein
MAIGRQSRAPTYPHFLGGRGGRASEGLASGLLVALLVVGTPACDGRGSRPADVVAFSSGSRLRAHFMEADGARTLVDFFDAQLGTACQFIPTTDGRFHCLPRPRASMAYEDAACTAPVLVPYATPSCVDPSRLFAFSGTGPPYCGREGGLGGAWVTGVFEAGDARAASDLFAGGGTAGCGLAYTQTHQIFSANAVDLGTFVAAAERDIAVGDGIGVRMLDADDGAHLAMGLYDLTRQNGCWRGGTSPTGAAACLPDDTPDASGAFFSDPACSSDRVAYESAACDGPAYVVGESVFDSSDCPVGTPTVYETGAPVDGANVFLTMPNDCSLAGPSVTGLRFFALGQATAPETFATVQTKPEGDGGRLVRYVDATASGTPLGYASSEGLFDLELGLPCTAQRSTDGTLRCISGPSVTDGRGLFADASCTQEVVIAGGCPAWQLGVRRTAPQACGDGSAESVFEVGAAVSPPALYANSAVTSAGGPLMPVPCFLSITGSSTIYRTVGAARGIEAFPAVTETTE